MRYLLLTLSLFLAVPAFAADAVAAPDPSPLMQLFLQYVAPVLFTGIGTLLAAVLAFASTKLHAAAERDRAAGKAISVADVAARATHIATQIVQDIQVTLRPELEAALADGKLTEEEKAKLKAAAMARLKATLGETGMAELRELLGIAEDGLGGYLSGLIESALVGVKAGSKQPVSPPAVTLAEAVAAAARP